MNQPVVRKEPPPYGQRKGWVPRSLDDFGDGGAFPEIMVAQYPLNMGAKNSSKKGDVREMCLSLYLCIVLANL